MRPNPVKAFCEKNGVDFCRDDDWQDVRRAILKFEPHFLVVASYGKIIPSDVLNLLDARRRLNVHPSLLPRWRGPAPIQWTILSGDKVTGVSICLVDEKVDRGDIIFQVEERVSDDDDFLTLGRLFDLAGEVVQKVMEDIVENRATFLKQDEARATWARRIRKEDGSFSFRESAEQIHRKMRAFLVWPKIYTYIRSERIIVHRTYLVRNDTSWSSKRAGDVLRIDEKGIYVMCGGEDRHEKGVLILSLLQREGGKVLKGKDFANGMRIKVGDNILDDV